MSYTEQAITLFNNRANDYEEKFMYLDLYNDTFDLFCEKITKQNPEILELGCGPGNITRYLLNKRPDFKMLCTDLAPNMLALARKNNPAAAFQLLDCREIEKLNKKYNAIVCGFCLPYLSKEETLKLLNDASLMLNENGVLYISTMEDAYSKSGIQTSSQGDQLHMYYHEENYLTEALTNNNFTSVLVRHKDYPQENGTTTKDLILIATK